MNRKQKYIITVGMGLILLSGLFPAFEGEWRKEGDNLKTYLGYYFIFSPPDSYKVAGAFTGRPKDFYKNLNIRLTKSFNSNIIASRFFIQIVTILLLTVGLIFLFKDTKRRL